MKRITVEMVKEAYQKTGLKPRRGTVHAKDYGGCCGIGALAVAAGATEPYVYADKLFGESYSVGFMIGFDGHQKLIGRPCKAMRLGYSDGLACAAAVFGEPSA